jgi:cytosine/adenosine deaminase-related metal-dependent hydrolase
MGSLEGGRKADVVVLRNRLKVPLVEPNVKSYVVGTWERMDVNDVVIDGTVVLKDGEFIILDEEEVRARSHETATALWKRNGWPTP